MQVKRVFAQINANECYALHDGLPEVRYVLEAKRVKGVGVTIPLVVAIAKFIEFASKPYLTGRSALFRFD